MERTAEVSGQLEGMGGSLAADKGEGWVEMVLGDAKGAECDTD